MYNLKTLAKLKRYKIRPTSQPLAPNEDFLKVVKPFDLSEQNCGTIDGFKYYNDFYLYPLTN